MAKPVVHHCSIALQVLTVFYVLGVLVSDVQGGDGCPSFSCGHLREVRYPFRRLGDPPGCGVGAYELICTSSKAKIQINTGTYYVTQINYTGLSFWVVDPNLDMNSSCPLPRSDQFPYPDYYFYGGYPYESCTIRSCDLHTYTDSWACFANCSRAVKNISQYKPVACLSAKNSHVYVWDSLNQCRFQDLQSSCSYLAMIPFGNNQYIADQQQLTNASYADIMGFIMKGFSVQFPLRTHYRDGPCSQAINTCLKNSTRYFKQQISDANVLKWPIAFFWSDIHFVKCVSYYRNNYGYCGPTKIFFRVEVVESAINIIKLYIVLCRLLLAPLAVLIFLAYKYWKTRITIDSVEKFLRMQTMLGPRRYAYTDITAITGHFRDKLGQGGYGSVFKGVLLPGNVHVAVKMLEGNSNCNGEDFISEVSTIGRIHHVNVVHLLGFCSEEMRRALVYEYMPRGSLDKFIFSAEKIFSWDKLSEIALGIARGIDYLHQGCEMQILHFDIKPHNILLDCNLVPKVADFGLAKLYPRDNSFVPLSALRGTVGYIAPEMISRSFGVISSKSDVYSFGMLLLEMSGGRRNADPGAANSSQAYYPSWVYDRLTERELDEISPTADMHELERKLCIVGLWCIQMRSQDRPTMSEVIDMLEGVADNLQMPSRPFFCDEGHNHIEDSYQLSSQLTTICEEDE
ncbi:hypothetical protein QYE76_049871 [Lolium multiflorum]|uniref:Protein kinase domain-containing protein n=1 Tax=Lolium multiflorum TaxID=4521 RepID=A0AAD8SQH4_LOLMU|nr:hypothetical protein QYE76_049871 [Lolium multiflorum]